MNYKELENDCKLCFCLGITVGQIRDAISSGADSVDDIINETKAGTRCRLCKLDEADVNNKRPYYIDLLLKSEKE